MTKPQLRLRKAVKIACVEKDLTQVQLAEKMGVTKQGFSVMLRRNDCRMTHFLRLAEALNEKPEDLLDQIRIKQPR